MNSSPNVQSRLLPEQSLKVNLCFVLDESVNTAFFRATAHKCCNEGGYWFPCTEADCEESGIVSVEGAPCRVPLGSGQQIEEGKPEIEVLSPTIIGNLKRFKYTTLSSGVLKLQVFSSRGEKIIQTKSVVSSPGSYWLEINDLALKNSGTYFCLFELNGAVVLHKILVTK